jgi:hypothetical protein
VRRLRSAEIAVAGSVAMAATIRLVGMSTHSHMGMGRMDCFQVARNGDIGAIDGQLRLSCSRASWT